MHRSVLALLITLLYSALCLGKGPVIGCTIEDLAGSATFTQSLDLWIETDGPWYLWAETEDCLRFSNEEGQFVPVGQLASGVGPGESSHHFDYCFDVSLLEIGPTKIDMQVSLEGAQGVLGLPVSTQYWILPLDSDQVRVLREEDGYLGVSASEWFLLSEGDRVFYGVKEILKKSAKVESAQVHAQKTQIDLWWDSNPRRLEPGAWGTVRLILCGPSPGGELILGANSNLHLGDIWVLGGKSLDTVPVEDGVVLSLPALGPGKHELKGSVQALLPLPGGGGEIWAWWQGRKAWRMLEIDRSWFDHDGLQTIPVNTTSPFVLPNGAIRHQHGKGEVTVQDGVLDVLIPLDHPKEPIWTGLPLLESTTWSPKGKEVRPSDFFLPIFLWDDGFSWRLLAKSGPWFLDATGERQIFSVQGKSRSVEVSLDREGKTFRVSSNPPTSLAKGSWRWQETSLYRKGTYHQGRWLWSLEVPRAQGELPTLAARYSGERFSLETDFQDLSLRCATETWSWGARLKPGILWLDLQEPPLRLVVERGRVKLDYRPQERRQLKLEWDAERLRFDLVAEPWEAYFTAHHKDSTYGVRYRRAGAKGPWLAATKAGVELKNHTFLAETQNQLGYVLGSSCTLYVEGTANASFNSQEGRRQTNFRYGAGLIAHPLPQVVALVGWDNEQQWHLKFGVALPFVGRKSFIHFE